MQFGMQFRAKDSNLKKKVRAVTQTLYLFSLATGYSNFIEILNTLQNYSILTFTENLGMNQ